MVIMIVFVFVGMMVVMAVTVCAVGVGSNPLDVVMMAFLRKAYLVFETQNLFAVFAHLAIHIACAFLNFFYPVHEGFEHERLGVQIRRL